MAIGMRNRGVAALVALTVGMAGLAAGDQALAVGGESADASYGYVVRVHVGAERACTGVRLDPQLVATAKACFPTPVTGPPAVATTVVTRPDQNAGTQTVAVDHLFVRDDRDLVVAHLAQPVTGLRGDAPVSVSAPAAGETLRVLGFGRTSREWVPNLPHTAQYSVQSASSTGIDILPTADGTVCKGDAGGPVIRENSDGTASLIGLLSSSGQGGCLAESSTARDATATRVDGLAGWVDQFRETELTGVVEAGTESGCLVLRDGGATYHLAGGDAAVVKTGETVHLVGYRAPTAGDTCTQGARLRVTQAFPVVTLVGTVTRGAEGCLLLSSGATYRLAGGDPAVVKAGAAVSVTGYAAGTVSSCGQGTGFRVQSAVPATPVSLRARVNNKFVTAEEAGAKALIANRDTVGGSWEVFDKFDLGDDHIALRARVNGKYVTAESAGAAALIANRDTVGGTWEKFLLVRNADGSVSLKAVVNGMYVTAENAGAAALIANRPTVGGSWERFDLIDQ
jgi:hypothetical protein